MILSTGLRVLGLSLVLGRLALCSPEELAADIRPSRLHVFIESVLLLELLPIPWSSKAFTKRFCLGCVCTGCSSLTMSQGPRGSSTPRAVISLEQICRAHGGACRRPASRRCKGTLPGLLRSSATKLGEMTSRMQTKKSPLLRTREEWKEPSNCAGDSSLVILLLVQSHTLPALSPCSGELVWSRTDRPQSLNFT